MGTTLLAAGGPLAHLAQSCVRGPLGKPCGTCVKCFRKRLVQAAVLDAWPHDSTWRAILASYAVRSYLAEQPLHQPAGVIWAQQRYPGRDPLLRSLSERLDADATDVELEARLAAAREELQVAEGERDVARQRLEETRASTSYRVGHAIVRASRPLRPRRAKG